LQAAGSSLDNVIKMNIYLTDMANFGVLNEAYDEFFTQDIKPVGGLLLLRKEETNISNSGQNLRGCAPAAFWNRR
jgi:hypothetical protein